MKKNHRKYINRLKNFLKRADREIEDMEERKVGLENFKRNFTEITGEYERFMNNQTNNDLASWIAAKESLLVRLDNFHESILNPIMKIQEVANSVRESRKILSYGTTSFSGKIELFNATDIDEDSNPQLSPFRSSVEALDIIIYEIGEKSIAQYEDFNDMYQWTLSVRSEVNTQTPPIFKDRESDNALTS